MADDETARLQGEVRALRADVDRLCGLMAERKTQEWVAKHGGEVTVEQADAYYADRKSFYLSTTSLGGP